MKLLCKLEETIKHLDGIRAKVDAIDGLDIVSEALDVAIKNVVHIEGKVHNINKMLKNLAKEHKRKK